MSTLVQEIEARIGNAKAITARQNVGVIREIGDGVARVEGLSDVMLNEMLDLGHGITGLALSLEETDVGVVILGDDTQLEEGGEVRATGKLLQVPVGKGLLGRVVNTLGQPLDGKGPIASDVAYPVEKIAPGIMQRRPISQPVQSGIMAIDAMIPPPVNIWRRLQGRPWANGSWTTAWMHSSSMTTCPSTRWHTARCPWC